MSQPSRQISSSRAVTHSQERRPKQPTSRHHINSKKISSDSGDEYSPSRHDKESSDDDMQRKAPNARSGSNRGSRSRAKSTQPLRTREQGAPPRKHGRTRRAKRASSRNRNSSRRGAESDHYMESSDAEKNSRRAAAKAKRRKRPRHESESFAESAGAQHAIEAASEAESGTSSDDLHGYSSESQWNTVCENSAKFYCRKSSTRKIKGRFSCVCPHPSGFKESPGTWREVQGEDPEVEGKPRVVVMVAFCGECLVCFMRHSFVFDVHSNH